MKMEMMQIKYDMLNSRGAANELSADGRVSLFQKSLSFIFQVNNFFKG